MVRRSQTQAQIEADEQSLQAVAAFNESFGAVEIDNGTGRKRTRSEDEVDLGDPSSVKRMNLDGMGHDQGHIQHDNMGGAGGMDQDMDDGGQDEYTGEDSGWALSQGDVSFQDDTISAMQNIWIDPSSHLQVASLPILENLSVQLLSTLARGPYQDTINIVTQPESDLGQAYATLKSLFDQTKRMYSTEPFLSADILNLRDPDQRATVRKANLATFVSSVFGSQDVGFYHLNEHFLDTFISESGKLLKSQGGLYLDLKTQAYISALSTGERGKEEILNDLFPADMDTFLLQRRGATVLTPSEIDFVSRARSRRDHLLIEAGDGSEDQVQQLMEKYIWQEFLRDISIYVRRNIEAIVAPIGARRGSVRRLMIDRALFGPPPSSNGPGPTIPLPLTQQPSEEPIMQDIEGEDLVDARLRSALNAENAALDAQRSQQGQAEGDSFDGGEHSPLPLAMSLGSIPGIPHTTQSAPTQVLYERARLAASTKASATSSRRGGGAALPSQRRPWTTEEENALMAGLDHVRGPHWSRILQLFGPGGSISEVLKDRNQVQLKDKARNLKLFFLKEGVEVPHYLKEVTGELKTRAPGVMGKRERDRQDREGGKEEDRRRELEGVLALGRGFGDVSSQPQLLPAGGLPNASGGAPVTEADVTAAAAAAAVAAMGEEDDVDYTGGGGGGDGAVDGGGGEVDEQGLLQSHSQEPESMLHLEDDGGIGRRTRTRT